MHPSYYKKPAPAQPPDAKTVVLENKYGLRDPESTKVPLGFRERCYQTVEGALQAKFNGPSKSLTRDYFSKLTPAFVAQDSWYVRVKGHKEHVQKPTHRA